MHESPATRASWNDAQNALLGYPREAVPLGGGRHTEPPPVSQFAGDVEDPETKTPAVLVDTRVTVNLINESPKLSIQDRTALLEMLTAAKDVASVQNPFELVAPAVWE